MNNLDKPFNPNSSPDRRRPTKAEMVMESPEYRKERLQSLTGIADEQRLFEIYYQLREALLKTGLENLKYRRNTVDGRRNTEYEFSIKNLDGEELENLENVLRELNISGFPEPVEGTNHTDLVIEYKRDLEVLRLMSVFKDLDREAEDRELVKKIDEETKRIRAEAEAHAEEMRRWDIAQMEGLREQERLAAEQRLHEDTERAKVRRVEELEGKWVRNQERDQAQKSEERRRMDQIIDEVLAKIAPQEIELGFNVGDLKDPFEEVTSFRGMQPRFPREARRTKIQPNGAEDVKRFLAELDPVELDDDMQKFTDLWKSGQIVDLEHEPLALPGGRPDLGIFPKKFVWKYDAEADKTRCYEYDARTRKAGKEVTREEREQQMLRLKDLRQARFGAEKEKGATLPKSREEVELEQKVVLLVNNLIVWLINDLTTGIRGNQELREIKANDADDLYQNAIVGLFYAIDNHDPEIAKEEEAGIISYVVACMKGHLRKTHISGDKKNKNQDKGMNLDTRQVRLTSNLKNLRRLVYRIERNIRSKFPGETDEHLMARRYAKGLLEAGVPLPGDDVYALEKLHERLLMDYEEVAYDILEGEDENPDPQLKQLGELLRTEPEQEQKVEREHLKAAVNEALLSLTPREERVLRMRFFPQEKGTVESATSEDERNSASVLDAGNIDGLTLDQIADHFSVTRERIRQIERKALRKIRGRMTRFGYARKLRDFSPYEE